MDHVRRVAAPNDIGVLFENEAFLEQLEVDQKPVLIRKGVSHWSALVQWTGKNGVQNIKKRVCEAPVQVMCSTDTVFFGAIGKHRLMHCKMGEFLDDQMQQKWIEMNLYTYLAQARIDEGPLNGLMKDVQIPSTFYENKLNFQVNLWMSLRSVTRSSPHFDPYENLLCLIDGKKMVKLYPVSTTNYFYPYPIWSESHNHSEINFVNPDWTQHPTYRKALEQESTVSMEPGDVLYIPKGWWHQIDSLEGTIALNLWWTSKQSHELISATNREFYLRQILKQMTTDEVENIIKEIQPLESMLSQSNSLPTNSVLDCESERPNKRSKTSTESLFTLSAYENQGLEDLINILNKDAIGSELSVEICPEDKISRWLRSCPSQSVCRMLYNLSAKHKESSEQFWLRGLSPLSCHLLTDHFQAVHADPLFKEEFFEMLHEAIPNREEVLTKMNEGTETLMKFAYQRVLENNNIIESKL